MLSDRFDQVLWTAFVLFIIALGATSAYSLRTGTVDTRKTDRNLEQQIAERARTRYLEDVYMAVTVELDAGRFSRALLALEEVQRSLPDEAYGQVLKGVILTKMNAIDAAVASFVAGIKRNGDYIDRRGSLSQRETVAALVARQLPYYTKRVANDRHDTLAASTKKQLHYLQSRLAGGCE